MDAIRRVILVCAVIALAACGGGGGGGGGGKRPPLTDNRIPTGDNVVPISVNGALGPVNLAYVTVTVCEPASTTNCVAINNVLVDTGSTGLRVLASAVANLPLQQRTNSGNEALFECAQFVDLTHAWGAVKIADVRIGGKVAANTNIQTIGISPGVPEPAACGVADENLDTAAKLGANGILGVGHYVEDCGLFCEQSANPLYYGCSGATCATTTVLTGAQVQNPVARFSSDNNGAIVQLPAIAASGVAAADGWLIFGIDTRANNAIGNAARFTINASGFLNTRFNGTDYANSFVDSGSNGLFFPNTRGIATCPSNADFYCPASALNLSATVSGSVGSSAAREVNFSIANAAQLDGRFNAFNNLGGVYNAGFDWGLPFFFGRKVFTALETNAGGPYVAF